MPKPLFSHYLWVAASLTLAFIPFFSELPIWILLSMVVLIATQLKLKSDYKHWYKGLLPILVVAYTYGIYLQAGKVVGQDEAAILLVTMLTLKFLESKNVRDLSLVIFITFILTLAKYLYSQSLLTGAFMLFLVWFNGVALISINSNRYGANLKYKAKLSLQILVQSIPVMLILFVLFPRISGPLWGIPNSDDSAVTGISESMSPGKFSNLTKSAEVAFRVKFESEIPPTNKRYWRGPVLWQYDGRTWTHGRRSYTQQATVNAITAPINYTVTLQPTGQDFLFTLDMPTKIVKDALVNQEFQIISKEKINAVTQYKASSALDYTINTNLPFDHWQFEYGTDLPEGFNPKTIAYGESLREKYDSDQLIINAALKNFSNDDFYYTLNAPKLGRHFADDFLFKSKRGFCEHYASTFVITMRAAGIPARVVTGYLGGEINNSTDEPYMIIRQSDAHAWAEVWLQGKGWVRVDPTGAVAPERIEEGIDAALPAGEGLSIFSRKDFGLLKRVQLMWDAANNNWDYWVLGYGPENQKKLLDNFGLKWSWQDMILAIMAFTFASIAIVFLFLMVQTRQTTPDPALRLYKTFLKKCRKKGVTIKNNEGPNDFAQRASEILNEQAQLIQTICNAYRDIRYANRYNKDNLKNLKQLIKAF